MRRQFSLRRTIAYVFCAAVASTLFLIYWNFSLHIPGAYAEISSNLHVIKTFNQYDQVLTETFVDGSGEPTIADDKGYSTIRYSYNNQKLLEMTEFLDLQGELVTSLDDGYAVCKLTWNSRRQLLERTYADKTGKPASGPDGYYREVNTYSVKLRLSTSHYDVDGDLYCDVDKGIFGRILVEYNTNNGNILSQSYYDR